jgi:hypothetical protein
LELEVREHPTYNGTSNLGNFLVSMEDNIVEDQRIVVLDLDTPSKWWASHKEVIKNWEDVKNSINVDFTISLVGSSISPDSIGLILKVWYIHEETRRHTNSWKTLADQICKDFVFTSKYP